MKLSDNVPKKIFDNFSLFSNVIFKSPLFEAV